MVFAYGPGDRIDGTYTVARAVIAPNGRWDLASRRSPLAMAVAVDLNPEYFAPKRSLHLGATKRLTTTSPSGTISVSRRFESWRDEDIVAKVRTGTPVEIVESRRDGFVNRIKVRFTYKGRAMEGWVFPYSVE
jgi:hypothetical protein